MPKGKKNQRIILNVFYSFLLKGGGLVINLLLLPAYLIFFEDKTILGYWFTVISVLSWILNFDIGVGNGLRNHLVGCFAKNDYISARKYISSAYAIFFILITLILIIGLFTLDFVDWRLFFNVDNNIIENSIFNLTVKIVFISICSQFFLRIIYSISYSLQNSYVPNLISLTSGVIQYILIVFAPKSSLESNLIYAAYANIFSVNIPLIGMTLYIFRTKLRNCIPNIKFVEKAYFADILKLGGTFFWIQIMYMLLHNTSNFFISWLDNPTAVVDYQIYYRIASLIGTVILLAMTPLWSEITEAYKLNNFLWLNKLFKKLNLFLLLATFIQLSMIPFYQTIIDLWLKNRTIEVNHLYVIAFSISGVIFIWNNIISTIVNGIGKLKIQFYFFTFAGILNFPVAFLMYKLFDSWISVVLANIIVLAPYCIYQTFWLKKYFNSKITQTLTSK